MMGFMMKSGAARGVLLALSAFVAYVGIVIYTNRMSTDVFIEPQGETAALTPLEGRVISVTTWNIGYGGLGAESDFYADGGKSFFPPSKKVVKKNVLGIVTELSGPRADAILMQETARASMMTRGVNVLGAVATALAGRDNAFSADWTTRFLPPPFHARHGLFTSVNASGVTREIVDLPLEPGRIMGLWKRRYHMQVVRIPFVSGEWTLIDVHLSAFDDGANVRLEQLRAVLDYAKSEYQKGHFVIIGGDWNYEFLKSSRPTTTEEKYLFWIHAFPYEELSEGWRAVADAKTPSVRTNERAYKRGENYTTTIDGFVISPNIEPLEVAAKDLDFQFTDHQPVRARFQAIVD